MEGKERDSRYARECGGGFLKLWEFPASANIAVGSQPCATPSQRTYAASEPCKHSSHFRDVGCGKKHREWI